MIVNRRVEQGVYVVLVLSLQEGHRPLRSAELSAILGVSDSYLKKILRKLVLAGIVSSSAGRDGGFQLVRSVEEISLFDVYAALEGPECDLKLSGIGQRIFVDDGKFARGEEKVASAFGRANAAFCAELRGLMLSELVGKEHYERGDVDFAARIEKLQGKAS